MDEPYFSVGNWAIRLTCRLRWKTTIYVAQYKQFHPAFFEILSSADEPQCVKTRGFKYLVFHIQTVAESRPPHPPVWLSVCSHYGLGWVSPKHPNNWDHLCSIVSCEHWDFWGSRNRTVPRIPFTWAWEQKQWGGKTKCEAVGGPAHTRVPARINTWGLHAVIWCWA